MCLASSKKRRNTKKSKQQGKKGYFVLVAANYASDNYGNVNSPTQTLLFQGS
jgi:hypothetical protein